LSFGRGLFNREPVTNGATSYRFFFRLKAEHIVMSQLFGWEGALALGSERFAGRFLSPQFPTFLCDSTKLDRRFLGWFIKRPGFWKELGSHTTGMGDRRRTLNPDALLSCQIPLPQLADQHKLVERIDALAARIEEAKQLCHDADYNTAALMAAHTLRLFEDLAKSHPVRNFAQFEPHFTSGPRNWGHRTVDSGHRFYRAQDILAAGRLATSGSVFIELPASNQGAGAKLKPGDLMIVITGATVGRVAVYSPDFEPGYVSQHVAICRVDNRRLDPRYALHGLLSPYGQEQLLAQRYGQGKPGLNLTNIRNLRLPIPPIPVQNLVVELLQDFEEGIRRIQRQQVESREQINAMLPAILERAFEGQL
jgi:type I restriction enzyme S subunit